MSARGCLHRAAIGSVAAIRAPNTTALCHAKPLPRPNATVAGATIRAVSASEITTPGTLTKSESRSLSADRRCSF